MKGGGERVRVRFPQSFRLATKVYPGKYTLQMMETKENILIGHKAKL